MIINKQVDILEYQEEALLSKAKTIYFSAGIGCGKTYSGSLWLLQKIIENPGCECLIAACTYSQLMAASVKTFIELLDNIGIKYDATLSGAKKRIEVNGCLIYLYSLENPDSIRGISVSYCWLDELAFSTENALQVVQGRMRGTKSKERQMFISSSPNGFNFCYELSRKQSTHLITAKTWDNTFLPLDYVHSLVEQYGGSIVNGEYVINTPLAKQEILGEFVNLQAGAVYSLFERGINVLPCQLNKQYPVYVGIDFNIDCMNMTYNQFIGGKIYCCKEVSLTNRDANTLDAGKRIITDLSSQGYNVIVVPDSTGKARKTASSSSKSDHQILRDLGLRLADTHNPLIRDRQNNLNIKFHKKEVVVDTSCNTVIKEIETLSSRDTEGNVAHASVTLGYVVWLLMPLKAPQRPSMTYNI